jgi:hypothetical protein
MIYSLNWSERKTELTFLQTPTQTNISSHVYSATDTRLQGPWLLLARVGWIGIVVPLYALFVANVPAYFASLHLLHAPNVQTFTGQLTLKDVYTLQAWGLSLDFYATCMVVGSLLFQFSYASVGALLFWRKAGSRIALLTSFALMMLPFGFANLTLQALPPGWSWIIPTLSALGNASLLLCAFVFPDGRFVPRWTRWLAMLMLGYWVIVALLPSWGLDRSVLSLVLFFGFVVGAMLIQLYRYRYVSTPRQRQQTKWALFGVSVAVVGNIGPRLLYYFVLLPLSGGSPLAFALEVSLIMCSMLAIPFTLGSAILRYRLWDVDIIINRTLVYGTLTFILALVYAGLVIALQALVRVFTGQASENPLVIVGSTLVIATLSQPLRRRIQSVIDHRFYRRKYDATRTLAAFSATLHNEVDLSQLSEQLLAVIEETLQPTHVSLWLFEPEKNIKSNARYSIATPPAFHGESSSR